MAERTVLQDLIGRIGFRTGLLIGAAAIPLYGAGAALHNLSVGNKGVATPHYSGTVRTSGTALSSRGGVKLILSDSYETIVQTCRGVCDDLSVDSTSARYGEYKAKVLNAKGECVACAWGPSRMPGKGMSMTFSLVGGGIVQTTTNE